MVMFCQQCASVNAGRSGTCRVCGQQLKRDSLARERWNDPVPEPEDALGVDIIYAPESRRRERVLSAVATVLLLIVAGVGWWFAGRDDRPECVVYAELNCRVVVVQREVAPPSDEQGDDRSPRNLSRTQAEVLDWLRLVELGRSDMGTLSEASVFAVAADRDRLTDLCTDVASCRRLGVGANLDLDGASGRLDFAADGSQMEAFFRTSRAGRLDVTLLAEAPDRSPSGGSDEVSLTRILVVANTRTMFVQLRTVVQEFRAELARAGERGNVHLVMADDLRLVQYPGVRIVVGRGAGRLWSSLRTHEVSVGMQLIARDGSIARTFTFEPAISQVLDASADGLGPNQRALLLTDCRQRRLAPGTDARGGRASVKVECISHPNELRDMNLEGWDRIVLLAGPSERGFATELSRALANDPTEIVALRLN
jgi:hypothetical protein